MTAADIYNEAKKSFQSFTKDLDDGILPTHPISRRQVQIYRWARSNFGGDTQSDRLWNVLGANEEIGELFESLLALGAAGGKLAHVMLKSSQKIRGYADPEKTRAAIADSLADIIVFSTQIATAFELDMGLLYELTLEEVLQRNWKKNPTGPAETDPLPLKVISLPREAIYTRESKICQECGAAHPEDHCSEEF